MKLEYFCIRMNHWERDVFLKNVKLGEKVNILGMPYEFVTMQTQFKPRYGDDISVPLTDLDVADVPFPHVAMFKPIFPEIEYSAINIREKKDD